MILHTINASPTNIAFQDCLKILQPVDALVLMGDSVYAALEGSEAFTSLLATGAKIHVLHTDAKAAGIAVPSSFEEIDMDGLVTLTEQFERQLAWY